MSYELISCTEVPCPCGEGKVVTEFFMNDWGQTRESITIQCEKCRASYETTHRGYYKNGLYESYPALITRVPEPEPCSPGINIYTTPLQEQYCIRYSYTDLLQIAKALASSTTYKLLTDENARKAVRMCKASCNTQRMDFVREKIAIALDMYKTYDGSLDNIKKLKAEYDVKWPRKVIPL